jgi:hypothetical protein
VGVLWRGDSTVIHCWDGEGSGLGVREVVGG